MQKTSIHFQEVKPTSEMHNTRRQDLDYVNKSLSPRNEQWIAGRIRDKIHEIETYCKTKTGRKLQKNAHPIREAVVVVKEDTTMEDLKNLSLKLEEQLGISVFQIFLHRDEGHYDKESREWMPNYHAHLVAGWQDKATGKTLKHNKLDYSRMQDLTAECLSMERGEKSSKHHLKAIEFKIQKKREELEALESKILLWQDILEKDYSELVVMDKGGIFSKEKPDIEATLDNFRKAFAELQLLATKQEGTIRRLEEKKKVQEDRYDHQQKTLQDLQQQHQELQRRYRSATSGNRVEEDRILFDEEYRKLHQLHRYKEIYTERFGIALEQSPPEQEETPKDYVKRIFPIASEDMVSNMYITHEEISGWLSKDKLFGNKLLELAGDKIEETEKQRQEQYRGFRR